MVLRGLQGYYPDSSSASCNLETHILSRKTLRGPPIEDDSSRNPINQPRILYVWEIECDLEVMAILDPSSFRPSLPPSLPSVTDVYF